MELDSVQSGLLAALLVVVVLIFSLMPRLFRRLESHHPEQFIALDRPALGTQNRDSADLLSVLVLNARFLFQRGYAALGDPQLARIGNGLLLLFAVYAVLAGAFLLSLF